MASYRFSMDKVSRGKGHSCVAKAAYRSGERLECNHYGKTHDYTRKQGVVHSEIMAPDDAPEWATERAKLWNTVEASENAQTNRKWRTAQLALDLELSLPHELTDAQRIDWTRRFVVQQFVAQGMIADVNIHRPNRDGDDRNHHAHVMLTMRELKGEGFGEKRPDWWGGEKGRKSDRLAEYREAWGNFQNREFERLGLEVRVDHRSHEAQGIDREPEQHEGPHATAMKRKGQETRIGQENADKQERNSARAWQHVAALKELAQIAAERARFNDWMSERTDHLRAVQTESLREMDDHHERRARDLSDELDAFYGPHLRTVEAEAARIHQRQEAKGILSTLRRIWTGRSDRDKLDQMQATIADTKQRMDEAKGKLSLRQQAERTRLQGLQETRANQQGDGLETARQRKEQALKPRENAARAVWEKATDPEKAAAQAERERRLAWYEQKKAPTKEAAPIDSPPKPKVSARDALDRELYNRAKGIDTRFDNSRLHVNRDVIERVERADHNARYEQNMRAKAEAEAPAKAAELARLREIAANRMDELSRQETPAQNPDRATAPQKAQEADKTPQPAPQSEFQKQAAQRVRDPQHEAAEAARALWENAPMEPQRETPSPARALWENAVQPQEPHRDPAADAARALWQDATPAPQPDPAPEPTHTPTPERSNER